jgi:hypothetical protein
MDPMGLVIRWKIRVVDGYKMGLHMVIWLMLRCFFWWDYKMIVVIKRSKWDYKMIDDDYTR